MTFKLFANSLTLCGPLLAAQGATRSLIFEVRRFLEYISNGSEFPALDFEPSIKDVELSRCAFELSRRLHNYKIVVANEHFSGN